MVSNPEETPSADWLFASAQERVEAKDLRGAFRSLLELLDAEPLHLEGLAATAKLAAHLGSREDADRFAAVLAEPTDPQALYDLGFTLVEQRRPALGVRYLELCVAQAPDHPLVRYELGYALFQAGRFRDALPHLARTAGDSSIAGPEPFAANLLMVECHVHLGDLDAARETFDSIDAHGGEQVDAQLDAVAGMIGRAARILGRQRQDARDWYFIEQGGAVLRVDHELPSGTVGVDWIADVLRRLEALLPALDIEVERVYFTTPETRPIAAALAWRLGAGLAEAAEIEPHPDAPSLLVAKDPTELGDAIASLRHHDDDLHLFVLTLDPRIDQVVAPDVVGFFSGGVQLPWEERLAIEGHSPVDVSARRIAADEEMRATADRTLVAAMEEMDGDDEACDEVGRYFAALSEHLVLGNADAHPSRRVYAALEVPRTFITSLA